jgi:putative MFS transporter
MLTLESLGWQWSYYLLACFSIPLIFVSFLLPESPKYEFMKKGKSALEKILSTSIDEEVEMHQRSKQPILGLFRSGLARRTYHDMDKLVLVSFVYYGIYTWAPRFSCRKGSPQSHLSGTPFHAYHATSRISCRKRFL